MLPVKDNNLAIRRARTRQERRIQEFPDIKLQKRFVLTIVGRQQKAAVSLRSKENKSSDSMTWSMPAQPNGYIRSKKHDFF